jgi:hypothetical protein
MRRKPKPEVSHQRRTVAGDTSRRLAALVVLMPIVENSIGVTAPVDPFGLGKVGAPVETLIHKFLFEEPVDG